MVLADVPADARVKELAIQISGQIPSILSGEGPNPYRAIRGGMSEANKARIRAFIDRVLTACEIEATGHYFHSDVVEEVPLMDSHVTIRA
jgi:hypothetical protein